MLKDQARLFVTGIKITLCDWLFLKKVEKAFNKQSFKLAVAKWTVESLERTLALTTASKKRRVYPDPNSSFSTISSVRAAQTEASRDMDTSSETSETEDLETEDCVFTSGL